MIKAYHRRIISAGGTHLSRRLSYYIHKERKGKQKGIVGAGGPPDHLRVLNIGPGTLEEAFRSVPIRGKEIATKFPLSLKLLLEHVHVCKGDFLLPRWHDN